MAAAILLNNYFGLKLFWRLKWRIIHHFWHLNGDDYLQIISEGKKKSNGTAILSGYGILDDYERYMDNNDEERSRSIPSRTKLGKRAAAIEKFPSFGTPLILFGGLITIPFWGYRTTSMASIDVMLADLPRVEYGQEKITPADIRKAEERQRELVNRIKTAGIGAKLSNAVNARNYIHSKVR